MGPDLSSRVALITGASRGIGRAIALKLARCGTRVVVNYSQRADAAEDVVRLIQEGGGEAVAVAADVSQTEDIERLVKEALSHFGTVDILINNAGIAKDNLLLRLSDADWDQVIAVNLRGAFLCTRAVLRCMLRQRWGRIINISSVVGIIGNPGQANYAAAKAGLIGLTLATAKEVASRGITVNAVAPGFIQTDMTLALGDKVREEVLSRIPLGRFGTPEEVAEAVAFLASEGAGYITGHVLRIDGGMG